MEVDNVSVKAGAESAIDEFGEDDIFFECPRCSKSMGIAKEGVGMIVKCPRCALDVIVPPPGEEAEYADESKRYEDSDEIKIIPVDERSERPIRPSEDFILKREKRDLLLDEIEIVQRTLDRIVAALDSDIN